MRAFQKYHPFVLALYFFAVLIISMFVSNPMIQIMSLIGAILFCIISQKEILANSIGFYIIFFLIISVSNPLFSHNGATPLFFLNGNPITLEAVIYGVGLGLTVISVAIWFQCMGFVFDQEKILYLCGKIIPKLALVLSMAFRFIPMVWRQAKSEMNAQKALDVFEDAGFGKKLKIYADIFLSVMVWAFEKSIDTSTSMKARGYGIGKRSVFSVFKFNSRDAVLSVIIAVLIFVSFVSLYLGGGEFDYYPKLSIIGTSLQDIFLYTAYGILVLVPFITEIKEVVLWKYCVWKI